MPYDLTLLAWVSLRTYVHVETHSGHQCFLYKNGPPNNAPGNSTNPNAGAAFAGGFASPSAQAWIDVESHQVVSVDDGTATYDFTFGPPPTAELVLPPKFASLWKGYQDAMNPLNIQYPPSH